ALQIHCRILMGAVTNTSVPSAPTDQHFNAFKRRFASPEEIDALLKTTTQDYRVSATYIETSIRQVRAASVANAGNPIANRIARVPDNALSFIFGTLHTLGIPSWRPDFVTGTPTSPYNASLEAVAIYTFQQAATTFFAYQHLKVDMAFIWNMPLLQRMIQSFLWHYIFKLVKKEVRVPGRVERDIIANTGYKRRSEVSL
ncbi:hypothetical protein BDZ89DRAFT_904687, partial [Hymenopellis radicata]